MYMKFRIYSIPLYFTVTEPSSFTTESGSVVPVSVTVSLIILELISISALIISFLVACKRRSKGKGASNL